MNIRNCVEDLVAGVTSGGHLDVFENYYADDVVMCWDGVNERVGKQANREWRDFFAHNVEFHEIRAECIVVDGDKSVIEWSSDITPSGHPRTKRRHVVIQTWRDGKIVRQEIYVTGTLWPTRS